MTESLVDYSLNIRIPKTLRDELEHRAEQAGYRGVSRWVEDLIRIALIRPPTHRDIARAAQRQAPDTGYGSQRRERVIDALQEGPGTSRTLAERIGTLTPGDVGALCSVMPSVEDISQDDPGTVATWRLVGDTREPIDRDTVNRREEANRLPEEWECPYCREPVTDWWPAVNKHLKDLHDASAVCVGGEVRVRRGTAP